MNPLEEKLVELLQENKEQNGTNSLHHLEAFYALSRIVTAIYEGNSNNIQKALVHMANNGKEIEDIEPIVFAGGHYISHHENLKEIRDKIKELVEEEIKNTQLLSSDQAKRKST